MKVEIYFCHFSDVCTLSRIRRPIVARRSTLSLLI